ncbi:T9SS type B sorting domain-containing protein [uncultured Aquimarina sp.]|uniref:T9SS type B sorting domain-containing protein n=1 Tax=uncultured Aquimarina sp. TaxID=575652 RepID=UPI002632A762|nr:T9SS type B sorting domain-containing protein [uncultured Aquimarina sp.]
MKTLFPKKAVLLILFIISTISNISAQESVPLTPRPGAQFNNIRGNMVMTGNDIVGVIEDDNGTTFTNPNRNYNGNDNNGNYVTAFIDVDNDDSTFSSSEAGLTVPREDCSRLVYAGLYWSANYYMARGNSPNNFSNNEISSNSDTNTALIINNGPLAQQYTARNSEFSNDNSDIQRNPVTSYLVVAQPVNGCGITNGAQLSGNIAVIRDGGSCSLREKVVNAQNAGAVGVVIVNDGGLLPRLTGNGPAINIPSVSIGNDDIDNANFNNGDLIPLIQAESNVILATLSTDEGNDILNNLPLTDPRKQGPADFRDVKFKVPGGTYVDVTASSVVFDGYRNTPTNPLGDNANDELPYVCYADVTSLLDPDNYFGTYTLANMNATQGFTSGGDGACGGWFIVAIYEDQQESAKFISTSDGFVQIFSGQAPLQFTYSGFTTPTGASEPVNVRFGTSSLEGDTSLGGDELRIVNTSGGLTALGQGNASANPTTNFFNGSISFDGNYITDRTPNSENTQGFDMDYFELPNVTKDLVGNGQTSATFELFTDRDRYSVFFNAFSVTIIEPELRIIKKVFDLDGSTEITGNNVELGDEVFYDLEIENIGNEDFVDGTVIITDVLPPNTNLLGVVDATLPPGVTYTEITPGVLQFNIPASIVETPNDEPVGVGDAPIFIRFRAQLVSSCEELRDACSDVITNSATATYTGLQSGTNGSTTSSSQLGVCGDQLNEASNILVNIPACQLDVTFCDDELLLVAGTGYNQYTWSGPGIATPVVTTVNFFNVPNPQTGVYTVIKEDTDGVDPSCMSLTEEFTVTAFRDITNPVLDYVNGTTIVTEDCSGVPIPQILLCGDQTQLLETNFDPSSLDDISWQRLTPSGSCVLDPNDPCSLLDGNCTDANWVEVAGGDTEDYTVSEAGDYRILAEFDGGCIIPFYFSVFKNDYQPDLTMNPIECGSDGSVSVINVPTNFAFSLTSGGPYTNTTGVFPISTAGDVTVYAIDTTFPGCEYSETINVPSIDPTFSVTGVDPTCVNDDNGTGFGRINISVTGGIPEYQYTISSAALGAADPIIVPNSSANNGNYTQNNLPAGTYTVEVISNRPTPECVFDATVTINPAPAFDAEVVLLAPETCDSGALVQVNVLNGSGDYLYDNGDGNFVACNIFEIPSPANPAITYTFRISDNSIPSGSPACVISASIDNITPYEPIVIDNVTVTQPPCPGDTGQIQVDVSPTVAGRLYTYQLWDCAADPNCGNGISDPADPSDEDPSLWTLVNDISSTGSQTITFTGVPDGNSYVVQVTHANTTPAITNPDCSFPVPEPIICPVTQYGFSISSPTGITADVTLDRPLSCIVGSEDAIIQVDNIAGGSGSYEWSLDNVNFTNVTTTPFDILVSIDGSYTIYIRNQGSADCAAPFAIDVPALVPIDSITFTSGNGDCTSQSSEVSFEAQPPLSAADIAAGVVYEYDVSPDPATGTGATGNTGFLTTNSYTIAQGITYTVTARRSDDQCTFNDDYRVDVIDPIDITNAVETTPVVCVGESNGALSFTVTNSTSFDYTVTLGGTTVDSGNGITTSPVNVTGLVAGTYTITVTDTNPGGSGSPLNCSDTATVDVTEPATPLTFRTVATETNCGANTGTITVTANGGRGNYQYRLVDSGGGVIVDYPNTNNVFTGLAVDTYTIFVRDGNSAAACEINNTESITQSASPTIALATGGDNCYDGTDQATQWVTITPGIPTPLGPFEYSLNGGTGIAITFLPVATPAPANTFEIPNLTPGNYTVVVTNTATNCSTAALAFTINPELTITADLANDINCNEDANITFTPAGGSTVYTQFDLYAQGSPPTLVQANITSPHTISTPGTYVVQVTDDQGCTAFSNPETVTAYEAIATSAPVVTNPDCPTDNGSIEITVTAGEGPFTYVLDGDATTTQGPTGTGPITFNNVPVGAHTITITDGSGASPACTLDVNATITAPVAITADIAITQEYRCDATGSSTTPQLGTITVSNPANGTAPYAYSIDGVDFSNTTGIFTGLTDGTYTLFIRDANTVSCPINLGQLTIDPLVQVTDLSFAATQVQCPALEADVTLTPTLDGTSTVMYEITAPITVGPQVSNVFTGLTSGTTYTFLARTDTDGCVYTETFTVPTIDLIAVNATVVNEPLCNGQSTGELSFTVSGIDLTTETYEYEVSIGGTIVAQATGQNTATIPTGDILAAGTYDILVTDERTNCTATDQVIIGEPDVITFTIDPIDQDCVANTSTVTISNVMGGSGVGYTWILNDSGGTAVGPSRPVTDPYLNVPNGTGYQIIVTDSNSCVSATQTLDINQLPQIAATIDTGSDFCLDDGTVSFTINIDGTNSGTPDYIYNVALGGTIVIPDTNVGALTTFTTTPALTQAGTYTITITDSNGCPVTLIETIAEAVSLDVTQVADITCNAAGTPVDASFSFVVNGGYTPYDIAVSFNGGAFVDHITNGTTPFVDYVATSGAGTYVFRVTDDRGCTFTTSPFTVTDPVAPTITAPTVNVDCFGDTGTAVVTVTGTETPYEIDFGNTGTFVAITGTQITFPNLVENTYNFTVRSSRGCLYPGTVEIAAPDEILEVSRTETPVTCGGSVIVTELGAIDLEISGGSGTYTYTLVDASDVSIRPIVPSTNTTSTNPVVLSASTTVRFEGLNFGQYFIFVEDDNGCVSNPDPIGPFNIFSPPSDLVQNVVATGNCLAGVIFDIDVVGGVGQDNTTNPPLGFDIRIVGEPSPGLGDFVPLNDEPLNATVTTPTNPIRIHRYGGMTAGAFDVLQFNRTYILEVRDNVTGCLYQELVPPVTPPSDPDIINFTQTNITCNETPALDNGTISFDISGYTTAPPPPVTEVRWEVFDQFTNISLDVSLAPAVYSGNATGLTGADVPVTISNFPPGRYYVVAEEVDGTQCSSRRDFEILVPDPLTSVATNLTAANSCGTNAQVIMDTDGGTPFGIPPTTDGYTYAVVADGAADPGTYPLNDNTIDLGNTAGDFDIWVADLNGCSFGPVDVTVVVNPLPTVTASFIDDCAYDNSNIIDVDGTGLGTLLYQINGGTAVTGSIDNNNHQFIVSTPGSYIITITDETGCSEDTPPVVVYDELVISAAFTTAPDCENPTGVITTTITSGVVQGTLTYVLQDGTGTPTGNVTGDVNGIYTGVAPGNYIVVATDDGRGTIAPFCSFSAPVSIDAPTPPVLVPETTFVTCIGDTDGVITAALTAASTDADPAVIYEYRISAPIADVTPFQTSPVFSGLGIGTYTIEVRVTKPNGALNVICLDTEDYIIDQPSLPVATVALETPYGCTGAAINLPVITVDNFAGGNSPYTISYTDPSGNTIGPVDPATLDTDSGLAGIQIIANESGNYTFTVFDTNDCPNVLVPFNIPPFPVMTDAVVNLVTGINCTTNTEEVTVTVTGGTGPFDFIEINGAVPSQIGVASGGATTTSGSFFLPGVGNYIFRVFDQGTQCSIETLPYEITPYDTIEANIAVVTPNILCFGDATGNIELTVTGHTGAYNYTVTNTTTGTVTGPIGADTTVQNPITITGLEAGSIQVSIIDPVSTCNDTSNVVNIAQPTELLLALDSNTNANCNDDGRVVVTASGGTSPYTFTATDVPSGGTFTTTNTTGIFDLPVTGASTDYTISVVDDNSCTSNPVSIVVTVNRTDNPVLINPLTVDDVCTHDGSYVISASGTSNVPVPPGSGILRFQLDTGIIEDANNGTTAHTFTVATPGTYTVTAYDENGCPSNVESITILPELTATADFTTDPTCRDVDGTITVTVNGGSDFTVNPGNFTFTLRDEVTNAIVAGPQVGNNIFTPIAAGDYIVEITDINIAAITTPCTITIDVPELTVPLDPIPSATSTAVSCIGATDGTVTVTLQTGTDLDGPYTYQIYVDDGTGNPDLAQQVGVDQIDNPVFTDLPFGDYVVVVTSDRSCSGQVAITVANATQVAVAISQSAYSCAPDNSSVFPIITVTITAGTAPYSISYETPSGVVITELDIADANLGTPEIDYEITADEEGDYLISVTDSNSCTTNPVTETETVAPFPIMTNPAVAIVTDITCAVDEEVTVSVQGGSGDFLFELVDNTGTVINPPAPVDTPAGVSTANFVLPRTLGIYTFRITDQITMCTITVTHEIDQFDFVELVAAEETPETCLGDADGTINISITGYTGPYNFTILDENGNPTAFSGTGDTTTDPNPYILPVNLPQGVYIVEIVETADPLCTERSNVVAITGPGAPIVTAISAINTVESCIPGSDGSFQASVTGAQGTVTYTLTPGAISNTTGLFENLTAGLYTVTAEDSQGCTDDEQFTIQSPNAIIVDPIADSSVTCFEDVDGSITVVASGGQGPGTYLYTLTFPDGVTTSGPQPINVFNNLGAGTYTITVSDNLNCTATTTAIINEPSEVTVNIDSVTEVTCDINTIDVTISGTSDVAIIEYYYVDQDGNEVANGGSGIFTGLGAGEYQFFVEDVNGCRSQLSSPVPVIPINQIMIALDTTAANINCFNEATAVINATVTGGIGDYIFELTNNTTTQTWGPQNNSEFIDLPPGNYTYLVRSDRNCVAQVDFDIINPAEFENIPPQITDVVCFGEDNGSIIVFAAGGTPDYSFAISTNPGQFFNDESDNVPNQHTFTNLVPGTYQVFAQDSNGCGQVYDVTIGEPDQLMANIVGAITPETCFGDSDGAVTIDITGGTPPYSTNITNNDGDFMDGVLTYMDLPGGTTTIFIRDANDCRINLPVDIPEGAILNGVMSPRVDCPIINTDGSINQPPIYYIDFILGDDSVDTDILYNLVSLDGGVSPGDSLSPTFIVQPGEYQGTMTYTPTGCVFDLGSITIEEYIPLATPIAQMTNNPQDPNEYEIIVTGGSGDYTYFVAIIPNGQTVNDLTDADYRELDDNIFSIDETAEYALRVVDNMGCEVVGVQELIFINIIIPNYFTPDGDGTNDTWYPRQDPFRDPFFFDDMEVKVFDRYGRLLAEFVGDQGTNNGWDGIYQGSELPSGDYWFTIILNDIDNREFTGHFTLYR